MDTFNIPGLDAPVYTVTGSQNRWTINGRAQVVPYDGPFPNSYLDRNDWAVEPWSGRIVAVSFGGGVSVLDAGSHVFRKIDNGAAPRDRISFVGPYVLPDRRESVVVGNGTAYVIGADNLLPWEVSSELPPLGIDSLYSIHDAPSLGGFLVVTKERRMFLRAGHRWARIGAIAQKDYGQAIDLRKAATTVFLANKSAHAIRKGGVLSTFSFQELATPEGRPGLSFFHSEEMDELLHYSRGGLFGSHYRWQRLTVLGLEDIEGGAIGTAAWDGQRNGVLTWVPGLGAVIAGDLGLYLYDGSRIAPLSGGDYGQIGEFPIIRPLAGINRTLLSSKAGVFEITPGGAVVATDLPFPTGGYPTVRIADWPEAHAAIVSTATGVYVLDQNLDATQLLDASAFPPAWLEFTAGTTREAGSMVLVTKGRMYLAVDKARSDSGLCSRAS